MRNKKPAAVFLFLSFSVMVWGCDGLFSTPIQKILENPRDYSGKTVTVSGEVTEVFSFLFIKYFSIRDKTGKIFVVTEKPLPKIGTRLKVKGTVEEAFSMGNKQMMVIVEKNHGG